jgi:prophage antirepressor-like protein
VLVTEYVGFNFVIVLGSKIMKLSKRLIDRIISCRKKGEMLDNIAKQLNLDIDTIYVTLKEYAPELSIKRTPAKPMKRKGGTIKRKPNTPIPDEITTQSFVFDGYKVNVILIGTAIWWVGHDVCNALGYVDCCDCTKRLPEHQRCTIALPASILQDSRNTRHTRRIIISESGLNTFLAHSQKPNAERFKKWVDETVIPSLHSMPVDEESDITVSQTVEAVRQKYNLPTDERKPKRKTKRRGIKIYCTFHILF